MILTWVQIFLCRCEVTYEDQAGRWFKVRQEVFLLLMLLMLMLLMLILMLLLLLMMLLLLLVLLDIYVSQDSCLAAQYTHLIVHGRPDYIKVLLRLYTLTKTYLCILLKVSLENDTIVPDGSTIGPYTEGTLVVVRY